MRYSLYHLFVGAVSRSRRRLRLASIAALAAAIPNVATADGAPAVLSEQGCGDCHRLEAPAPAERTLEAYASRKGPDLFYAGSKYRPEWLRAWLAKPTPIRPAGLLPAEHTRTEADGDHLGGAPPSAHPAVPPAKLDAVVKALAGLDWGGELLKAAPSARVAVPRPLAEMNFVKFKGCGSCHRTSASAPPASGPDLGDAFDRLRPEFIASVIATPQAWDPVAPMPGYGLEAGEVGKLVEFLRLVNEDGHATKTP